MLFRCASILVLTLLPSLLVHAQSKAVVATNYLISLNRSESDNSKTDFIKMNMVMPAGQKSGLGISYNHADASSEIPTTTFELDSKIKGYGISYFLRDYSVGRIGYKTSRYETLRLDEGHQSLSYRISNPSIRNITNVETDIKIDAYFAELYLKNTTLVYEKSENEYKQLPNIKEKNLQINWYLGPNFRVSYSVDKYKFKDSSAAQEKTESNNTTISYQPSFTKNFSSIDLTYTRLDKHPDEDTISLAFNFYFGSPVSLMDRDRKFQ